MQKYTKVVLATALLLVLTSWAVFAHGTDDANDWWTEMKEHHLATHGDDFDTHHQSMHGEDWQEQMTSCHSLADSGDMETGSMMGATL